MDRLTRAWCVVDKLHRAYHIDITIDTILEKCDDRTLNFCYNAIIKGE